ncbi:hypothetical protein HMPREF1979_02401 [Actinomyces johnsonii F0542]|uniref:Uncharacterized protein n=1 Tax=Actinomyces johnsonii F0542 TaxID=1321818 RepID=U1RSG5_9ACTO|nr:hypothetical protein HMPREF1979_02401 [Actinomyces johnsonii F0542]
MRRDQECASATAGLTGGGSLRTGSNLLDSFPVFSGKTLSIAMMPQGRRPGLWEVSSGIAHRGWRSRTGLVHKGSGDISGTHTSLHKPVDTTCG